MTDEEYERRLERSQTLTTEQYREHLKAIGEAIIEDASKIEINADNIFYIEVEATIAPQTSMTSIVYRIKRMADARMKKEI